MFLFAKYSICFWLLYFVFSGSGELIRVIFRIKDSFSIYGRKIDTLLFGIAFIHFSSSLLQLYSAHTYSSYFYFLILVFFCFIGIINAAISIKTKPYSWKMAVLHFLLFLFLLLPFRGFDFEFLASEESGDHTIYLGPAKAQYIQKDTEITMPKWNLTLTRSVYDSGIGSIFPALERFFPYYEAAKKAKWEIDPIDRVILEGFSPAWWALHWGLIGFAFHLPVMPETIYLSTMYFLCSLVGLQFLFISYLLLKEIEQYMLILFFLGLMISLSSCVSKITYGNFYLQLISLNSLLWLMQAIVTWIKAKRNKALFVVCLLSFIIGPSFYFMGMVYWGLIFTCFVILFYQPKLLGDLFRFIAKPPILIALFLYLPIILVNIGSFLKFLPTTSNSLQNKQYWDHVLGGTVIGDAAYLNPILGIATYFQFYPNLAFKREIDSLTFILKPFGIVIFMLLTVGILKSLFSDSRKLLRMNLFFAFVLFGIVLINFQSRTHYYNYNKASQYTFPFLIFLFPFFFKKLMQNKKFNYLLFTVLIGWILLLIPARFRQIESFSNFKANSLSYYLIYNEKIDIPINKTIFFFGEVKNHAALETFLAGYKTVPVGIYPIHSFKKFFNFQNIVSNQFMLKDRNSDFYSIYDYLKFSLSNNEYWISLSSNINLDSSRLPLSIELKQIGKIEVFANIEKDKRIIIHSSSIESSPFVSVEKYDSDNSFYLPAKHYAAAHKICKDGDCEYTFIIKAAGKMLITIEKVLKMEIF